MIKRRILVLCVAAAVAMLSSAGRADPACTASFTRDGAGTFPGTVKFDAAQKLLTVDLSGIPKDATIFRAELYLKQQSHYLHGPPAAPTTVYPQGQPDKKLPLVSPFYYSVDALAPVKSAVATGKPLSLVLETTGFGASRLEVSFTGSKLKEAVPVVRDLKIVSHRAGQTVLTFAEPALEAIPEFRTGADVQAFVQALTKKHPDTHFRIWRSEERITPQSIHKARLVGYVGFFSAWNNTYHQGDTSKQAPILRRVTDGDEGVSWGTGIYAHNPPKAGKARYAVTVAVDGQEDFTTLGQHNTVGPVDETVGPGEPILQWVERPTTWMFRNAVKGSRLARLIYTRWESWPNASVPSQAHDYLVAMSTDPMAEGGPGRDSVYKAFRADPAPVGLHLHCWGGSLNGGYVWWMNAHRGAVLIASNQIPYDWWTGYHERRLTAKTWADGHVQPFSTNRLLAFLDWATTQHAKAPPVIKGLWPRLDLKRVFTSGGSMGGSGSPMLGIRFGDRIAWSLGHVGVHVPAKSPQFKGSYEQVYGRRHEAITMPDGKISPWNWYSDVWWLRRHPKKETAFIVASNGKNDGAIGWEQAVEFARALQETRRPHVFNWAMGGHGTRVPVGQNVDLDIRTDQTLPAFSNCSLDGDVGTGTRLAKDKLEALVEAKKHHPKDPYDGDSRGQLNAYLWWKTDDAVDQPGRWEMTVALLKAPQDSCTVDLTPRRCQRFKADPGQSFQWTLTSTPDGKVLQSGTAKADKWGLVTVEGLKLGKDHRRLSVRTAQ